jgi:hypothetical protein
MIDNGINVLYCVRPTSGIIRSIGVTLRIRANGLPLATMAALPSGICSSSRNSPRSGLNVRLVSVSIPPRSARSPASTKCELLASVIAHLIGIGWAISVVGGFTLVLRCYHRRCDNRDAPARRRVTNNVQSRQIIAKSRIHEPLRHHVQSALLSRDVAVVLMTLMEGRYAPDILGIVACRCSSTH